MKWTAVKPDVSPLNLSAVLGMLPLLEVVSLVNALRHGPVVLFNPSARDVIRRHVAPKREESGGLLIGQAILPGELGISLPYPVICVSAAVRSEQSIGTSVSLEMDSAVWTSALKDHPPGSMVVGWFHSHPNLGAFFSGTDRSTQRNFFDHEYSLGYVIDPVRNQHAYFVGPNSSEVSAVNVIERSIDLSRFTAFSERLSS